VLFRVDELMVRHTQAENGDGYAKNDHHFPETFKFSPTHAFFTWATRRKNHSNTNTLDSTHSSMFRPHNEGALH
jgi:hypothetical protein